MTSCFGLFRADSSNFADPVFKVASLWVNSRRRCATSFSADMMFFCSWALSRVSSHPLRAGKASSANPRRLGGSAIAAGASQ